MICAAVDKWFNGGAKKCGACPDRDGLNFCGKCEMNEEMPKTIDYKLLFQTMIECGERHYFIPGMNGVASAGLRWSDIYDVAEQKGLSKSFVLSVLPQLDLIIKSAFNKSVRGGETHHTASGKPIRSPRPANRGEVRF